MWPGTPDSPTTPRRTAIDVTAPLGQRSRLDASITPDDIINIAESGGNVAITGTVGGDAANVGDTVTLTVNGNAYVGTVALARGVQHQRPGCRPGGGCRTSPSMPASRAPMPAGQQRATMPAERHRDLHDRRDRTGADHHPRCEHVTPVTTSSTSPSPGATSPSPDTVGGRRRQRRHRHPDRERQWPTWARWPRAPSASTCLGADTRGGCGLHHRCRASRTPTLAGNVTTVWGTTPRPTRSKTSRHRSPTVSTLDRSASTPDDVINIAESGGNVAITGTVGGDAANLATRCHPDGERQRLRGPNTVAAGAFSINVLGADLVADADFTIDASISSTDAIGQHGTRPTTPRPTRSM